MFSFRTLNGLYNVGFLYMSCFSFYFTCLVCAAVSYCYRCYLTQNRAKKSTHSLDYEHTTKKARQEILHTYVFYQTNNEKMSILLSRVSCWVAGLRLLVNRPYINMRCTWIFHICVCLLSVVCVCMCENSIWNAYNQNVWPVRRVRARGEEECIHDTHLEIHEGGSLDLPILHIANGNTHQMQNRLHSFFLFIFHHIFSFKSTKKVRGELVEKEINPNQ